jgi:hypothetical protein
MLKIIDGVYVQSYKDIKAICIQDSVEYDSEGKKNEKTLAIFYLDNVPGTPVVLLNEKTCIELQSFIKEGNY